MNPDFGTVVVRVAEGRRVRLADGTLLDPRVEHRLTDDLYIRRRVAAGDLVPVPPGAKPAKKGD